MQKIREKRKSKEQKKAADSYSLRFPFLSSRATLARNLTPKYREFSPLFCGPLWYPHQPSDISSQGEWRVISPTTTAGWAWPSHHHVTGRPCWARERGYLPSSSGSWRGIEFQSGVWTDIFASIRAVPSLWKGVATKRYYIHMNETDPQSSLSFFQQIDQRVSFLDSQNQYFYSCLTEKGKDPKVWMAKVLALVYPGLATTLPGGLLTPRPTGLGGTFCFGSNQTTPILYVRRGSLYVKPLENFQIKLTLKGQRFVSRKDFQKNLLKPIPKEGCCKNWVWLIAPAFKSVFSLLKEQLWRDNSDLDV